MNTPVSPASLRAFIPLFIVAALLVFGGFGYIIFKLLTRSRKFKDEKHSEDLEQELESGTGHSSVTCCGTVPDSKELKLFPSPIKFDAEFQEIVEHYTRLSHDMFTPCVDISPVRRSSSIYLTRSDSLPLPSRARLHPPSPRRASIPAMWSNPRSRWADENRLGSHNQGKIRYPSSRPMTGPAQRPKELIAPGALGRSITPLL